MRKIFFISYFLIGKLFYLNAQELEDALNNSFKIICYNENKVSKTGSGFIFKKYKNSFIGMTNEHVLDNVDSAFLVSSKSKIKYKINALITTIHKLDATIFRVNTNDNFKNLKIDSTILTKTPKIGNRIYTISSPKGLVNSVSDGIISSLRNIDEKHMIQITAPISTGSSGGLVINESGEPIGLIVSQYKEGQNLNFSVSLQQIFNELLNRKIINKKIEFLIDESKIETDLANLQNLIIDNDPILSKIRIEFQNNNEEGGNILLTNIENDYLPDVFLTSKCDYFIEKKAFEKALEVALFANKKYNSEYSNILLIDILIKLHDSQFDEFTKLSLLENEEDNLILKQYIDLFKGLYYSKTDKIEASVNYFERYLNDYDMYIKNYKNEGTDYIDEEYLFINMLNETLGYYPNDILANFYFKNQNFEKSSKYSFFAFYKIYLTNKTSINAMSQSAETHMRSLIINKNIEQAKMVYHDIFKKLNLNWSSQLREFINKYIN